MMIMTNAEAFKYYFGIFATELWSMQEDEFLEWLNKECDRERPKDMIVRCKDCKYGRPWTYMHAKEYVTCEVDCDPIDRDSDFFCAYGKRKEE